SAGRIVEAATRIELLFTTGEHECGIAIAATEGLVCVLHADSRERKWWNEIANRTRLRRRRRIKKALASSHLPIYPPTSRCARARSKSKVERRKWNVHRFRSAVFRRVFTW